MRPCTSDEQRWRLAGWLKAWNRPDSDGERTRRQPPASRLGVWDLATLGLGSRDREANQFSIYWARDCACRSELIAGLRLDRSTRVRTRLWPAGLGHTNVVRNRGPCSIGGPVPSSRSNLSIDGAARPRPKARCPRVSPRGRRQPRRGDGTLGLPPGASGPLPPPPPI
jgi:hypothetical protein